ncbi:hypothetical protein, conserved [Leishmania lindenbergi]|uniref:C3H1-type domain-containing protein n=1 Tax=Leishmania lindenbergi TaxID=651832 RepID=A0AAW2ZWR3_9TRYP
MYHGVCTPPQQPSMTSIVYVQTTQPSPVAYYAAEPIIDQQSIQALQQHQVSLVYPGTAAPQRIHAPHQPTIIPETYASEATPFYAYQPTLKEASCNTGSLVCLVPTVAASSSQQLSMLMQSLSSNSPSFHSDLSLRTQETRAAPQMMQQMLTTEYVQPAMEAHGSLSQSVIDPSTKSPLLSSSEVCRHYINGRCNRRKCRFLHPDLRSPIMTSHVMYIAPDAASIISNQSVPQVSPLTPYPSLSTPSLSAFHVPALTSWETCPL